MFDEIQMKDFKNDEKIKAFMQLQEVHNEKIQIQLLNFDKWS